MFSFSKNPSKIELESLSKLRDRAMIDTQVSFSGSVSENSGSCGFDFLVQELGAP